MDGRAGLSFSRQEVLALPSPVQGAGGVYDRWFHCLPPLVDARGCHRYEELTLLHARISSRQPPRNGSPSSQQTLRQRLRTHYAGNAEGSTLRKTLGYLLAGELNIQLRRVGHPQDLRGGQAGPVGGDGGQRLRQLGHPRASMGTGGRLDHCC